MIDWLDARNESKHYVNGKIMFISEWGNTACVLVWLLLTTKYLVFASSSDYLAYISTAFLVYVITTFVLVTPIFFIESIAKEYYVRHYDDLHNVTSKTIKSSDDVSKDDDRRNTEDTTDYSERIINATDDISKND